MTALTARAVRQSEQKRFAEDAALRVIDSRNPKEQGAIKKASLDFGKMNGLIWGAEKTVVAIFTFKAFLYHFQ